MVTDVSQKQLWCATVYFETLFEEARKGIKETKYRGLVSATERAGYNTTLITLEVGSWGTLYTPP